MSHSDLVIKRKRKKKRFTIGFPMIFILIAVLIIGFGVFIIKDFKSDNSQPLLMKYNAGDIEKYSISLVTADYNYELLGRDLVADSDGFEKDLQVSAEAALIYDITNREAVYSNNAFEKMYPASVTKLTTLLVALKYADLNDEVTVTEEMLSNLEYGSSLCGLKEGDTISMNDLLYGLMMPSGNDAACAIAFHMAGSEAGFADMMNQEVLNLGAVGTHYVNPHGLHNENHYTTAYDIYLVFNELLNYDEFFDIIGTQEYTALYHDKSGSEIQNTWNRGIWYFNNLAAVPEGITVIGGKTGTTPEAKYCLSLLSSDNIGNKYVSIVLHAGSRNLLYENMTNLLLKIDN